MELAFGVAFLAGAASLALWLDARLGETPSVKVVTFSLVAAVTAVRSSAWLGKQLPIGDQTTASLVSVIGITLPAVTFALLVSVWLLRILRDASSAAF